MDKQCPAGCAIIVNQMLDKFCYRCGQGLVPRETCACGRGFTAMDRFCPSCGKASPMKDVLGALSKEDSK